MDKGAEEVSSLIPALEPGWHEKALKPRLPVLIVKSIDGCD